MYGYTMELSVALSSKHSIHDVRLLVVDREIFKWDWKLYASKGFAPFLSLQERPLRIEKVWSANLAFTATFTSGWVTQEK